MKPAEIKKEYVPKLQLTKENGHYLVKVKSEFSKTGFLNLIVDNGSTCSILKLSALKPNVTYYPEKKVTLQGISGDRETQGAAVITVNFGRKIIPVNFQLVKESPPWYCDGILGDDVVEHCIINLPMKELHYMEPKAVTKKKPSTETLTKPRRNSPQDTCSEKEEKEIDSDEIYDPFEWKPRERCGVTTTSTFAEENEENQRTETDWWNPFGIGRTTSYMIKKEEKQPAAAEREPTRKEQIMASFKTAHMNEKQKKDVAELFDEFSEVFKLPQDPLKACTALEIDVPLKHDRPIHVKQYKLCKYFEEEAFKQVQKWLADGVIKPSVSPYNTPLLCVEKKTINKETGKPNIRVCLDLRKINEQVVETFYPLPPIHDLINDVKKARFFVSLDLAQGYTQMMVAKTCQHKLAFTIKNRRYECIRMPFGLKSAGFAFTKMIERALNGLDLENTHIYLDDILLTGNTEEEVLGKLRKILERFREFSISINPEKIKILEPKVEFLGFIISEEGVVPSTSKTAAIKRIPAPKNAKQTLSFLAMANFFKRHVVSFSELAEPLFNLTRKNIKFSWTKECQCSFEKIKEALSEPPVLAHMSELDEPGAKTIVLSDASAYAVGSCLAVLKGNDLRPISYNSRILNKAERGYSVYSKEFLAIVVAVTEHYKHYLRGRKFTILTDHLPLAYLYRTSVDLLEGRSLRWQLKLQTFDYKIVYVKGIANSVPDALSRLMTDEEINLEHSEEIGTMPTYLATTRAASKRKEEKETEEEMEHTDFAMKTVLEAINAQTNDSADEEDEPEAPEAGTGVKTITDEETQRKLISLFHDHPLVNHPGATRGLMRLKQLYKFKNMSKMYHDYVKNCETCRKCKHQHTGNVLPLGTMEIPKTAWENLYFDITGPYEKSEEGYVYVISVQCITTGFAVSTPLKSKEADSVATALVDEVFLRHGFPNKVTSDLAAEFTSRVLRRVLKLIKVDQGFSTIYHAQSNPVERYQNSLKTFLRIYLSHEKVKSCWPKFVRLADYCFNCLPNSRTGLSPFQLLYGRIPNDPITGARIPEVYTHDNYYDELRMKLKAFNELSREKRAKSTQADKQKWDKKAKTKTFSPGERVLVRVFVRKSTEPLLEEAVVVEDISEQNVKIMRKGKEQTVHKEHVYKHCPNKSFPDTDVTDEENTKNDPRTK